MTASEDIDRQLRAFCAQLRTSTATRSVTICLSQLVSEFPPFASAEGARGASGRWVDVLHLPASAGASPRDFET